MPDKLAPPHPLVSWGGLLLLIGGFVATNGPILMGDSPAYADWAARLAASGFDYAAMVRQNGSAVSLSYALFVTLLSLLRLGFGPWWPVALVTMNVVAMAGTGHLLTRLAWRLTGSGAASWAALILYALCWDLLQWSARVGSDGTFLLFAYAVFLMEARRILTRAGGWPAVFAASAAASFYRPTGIVLFPITAWSFFLARTSGDRHSRARILAGLFLLAILAAMAAALLWQDPGRWPLPGGSREIHEIARGYAQGQIVWDRRETYHLPPHVLSAFWAVTADRFAHFFAIGASTYSRIHWTGQFLFYGPVYLLSALFAFALLTGRTGLARPETDTFYAALGAIVAYACFHAVVQVDYDWRYRLPIMPHLILLAAGGVHLIVSRQTRRPAV